MKKLLFFFVVLCVGWSCSRRPSDDPMALGPYPPDLCSLIVRAQIAPMIEPKEVCCSLREEVERRLSGDTSAHTRALKLYFLGDVSDEWSRIKGSKSKALDSALRLVDSVRYPVMMHRIKAEILKDDKHVDKANWSAIMREIEYFRKIGDTLSMALIEVALGPLLSMADCYEEAMEVTKRVMKTLTEIGQPRLVSLTRINEAIYYANLGDSVRWDSVNRILLADEEIKRNSPRFREGVLRNTWITTKDTACLREGWMIVMSDSSMVRESTVYYAFFAHAMMNEGNPDSALSLLRQGMRVGEKFGFSNVNYRLLLLKATRQAFEMKHSADSALRYYHLAEKMEDSSRSLIRAGEVMRVKYGREMEAIKYEQALRRDRTRWTWSMTVAGIIICALVGFMWVWRQRQSTLLRLAREQGEMEKTRRELAASILVKQDKDNLLVEMNKQIDRMTLEGRMNHSAATDLQTMIRMHLAGSKEWEAFEELLVKIRPRFMERLHMTAPDMSMKYCRLAAYIYVGLSSQQIARLLMIRPMSVYQARWRLRRQLCVPEGEGIEEFLEKLGSE